MSGGFGAGFLKGAIYSLVGLAVASVAIPLDPVDPGSKTQTDLSTPEGSGFNAGRTDTNPSLPETDQAVEPVDTAQQPDLELESPDAPIADTTPAEQPETAINPEGDLISPETENDAALLLPDEEDAPPARIPALGVPMPEIENPVAEIPVNRLPSIETPTTDVEIPPAVSEDGVPAGESEAGQGGETTDLPRPEPGKALQNNRVAFQSEGKPLLSIILLDAGDEGLDRDVLLTFTFPVTFAIDPMAEGATAAAMKTKASGFEVLALAPSGAAKLEKAADPKDLEAALQDMLSRTPGAVGLIDDPTAALQSDRELATQVIEALRKTGHGLLTYDLGLNTTDQLARREGVVSGKVYRVLDQDRESGVVIKRYLDRAVLEAGKDGHVIVVGRSYPETITALFSWAVSAKSATVTMAPVSAALLSR